MGEARPPFLRPCMIVSWTFHICQHTGRDVFYDPKINFQCSASGHSSPSDLELIAFPIPLSSH